MTIEKTYKLTIKTTAYFLTEEEVSSLYEQCRKVLNISITGTNPTTPTYPNWPSYPTWPNYPWTSHTGNPTDWQQPIVTCGDNAPVSNCFSSTTPSTGINFLSDDMETIKDNNKWRSSVQQALDKLSDKTNVTTTSEGIKVG